MSRKVPKEGPRVFIPVDDDNERERPPAVPVRVGGKVLRCRGDGPVLRGKPRRNLTDDEYCGRPKP